AGAMPAAARAAPRTEQSRDETPTNPYAHSAVLDFDEAQVRQRFFELRGGRISPLRSPDAIPAPDDEFTALVDRAMVLGGYLTPADLSQIHEVGDLWRKHSQRLDYARVQGLRSGNEAVKKFRAEREALKQARRERAKERK